MTNAQKYAKLAEQEIAKFHAAQAENHRRHERAVDDDALDERYLENAFYNDDAASHLSLANIYAQLACVPDTITLGEPSFEEAAQRAQEPPQDFLEDLKGLIGNVPGIITLIQTSTRPRG